MESAKIAAAALDEVGVDDAEQDDEEGSAPWAWEADGGDEAGQQWQLEAAGGAGVEDAILSELAALDMSQVGGRRAAEQLACMWGSRGARG